MNYTQEQYETLYYLNKLLPRLKTKKNFERDLILAAQKIKEDLVPGLKKLDAFGNSSKIRKVLAEIEQVLAKYGENYPKITPTPAQKNMEYLVHIFRLSKKVHERHRPFEGIKLCLPYSPLAKNRSLATLPLP